MQAEQLVGKTLGTCTLQSLIGRGGMGAVFLAQQSRPRRQVAVKVLLPMTTLLPHQKAAFLERFRRESDAAASLEHPHIVHVHEYGEQNGLAYLVMPYISGGTLRDELETLGQLPFENCCDYLEQMASALDCAHERGVVHRDIKPANILMTPDKRLLLTDFGLVKVLIEGQSQQQLSEAGMPMGTPDYMAPEQVIGGEITHRADIYALGVILYHMLTGTVPFKGEMPMRVAMDHVHTPPPSPRSYRSDLPAAAEQVLLRALSKQAADRYPTAGDFSRAFRSALTATSISRKAAVDVPTTPAPARRGIFDPAWLKKPEVAQPAAPRKDIIGKNSITLPSFSGILTQAHLPAVVKPAHNHKEPDLIITRASTPDKFTPLPPTPALSNEPLMATQSKNTPLPPTSLRLGHRTSLRGLQQGPALSAQPVANNKQATDEAESDSSVASSPNEQSGGTMNQRDPSSQSPQAQETTTQGPRPLFGPKPAFQKMPQSAPLPSAPLPAEGPATRPFAPPLPFAANTRKLEPFSQEATGTFPNQNFQPNSTGTFPNQNFQPNSTGTFPNQNFQPSSTGTFPNQNFQPNSTGTFPNQNFQPNSTGTLPNQNFQPGSTGTFQQAGFQRTPTGALPYPGTGVTGSLPGPGSTGLLPAPAPGTTGALRMAQGDYNGETGMLKLAQPVRVVKVPVAGQPGQYMTGILPMLPPEPEPASLPLKERVAALPGTVKRNPKKSLLLIAALIILVGSFGFLLTRIPSGSSQASTSGSSKSNNKMNAASTATIGAQATADASLIMADAMSSNIHSWNITSKNNHTYEFKDGTYHIGDFDKENIAFSTLPDDDIPANLTYKISMYEVKGDDTNTFNSFGLMIRFNEQQQDGKSHVTFYAFKVFNTTSKTKGTKVYKFLKFDSNGKTVDDQWNELWKGDIGDEYHMGQGTDNTNTLKIVANADKFTFFVNDKNVGSAQDGAYPNGRIGMEVDNNGTEVAFKDLLLTRN
ncbi:serine/threonine protein kinase [Tengunoibacter tsumagoiensis]|uniref:non-specific serine/threonine protein kinase n=1 Tax=Tengunoibacter tsumagoiensis TaxID=2014871 RepID=A0A401ZWT0_9CHLR|nr:serine/threonine-protein kinase [Tengunoibacter tsumagoiensis]GCE11381.1 hypothetical protein KTT_12400 [Tengunoibacter tsumagoiensis]